jgi:hypothetical protein
MVCERQLAIRRFFASPFLRLFQTYAPLHARSSAFLRVLCRLGMDAFSCPPLVAAPRPQGQIQPACLRCPHVTDIYCCKALSKHVQVEHRDILNALDHLSSLEYPCKTSSSWSSGGVSLNFQNVLASTPPNRKSFLCPPKPFLSCPPTDRTHNNNTLFLVDTSLLRNTKPPPSQTLLGR